MGGLRAGPSGFREEETLLPEKQKEKYTDEEFTITH
jgi:hypothetical protein